MSKPKRVIEWFCRKDGRIIGQEEIKEFNLEFFKKLFKHTYADDPYIYDVCYDILPKHISTIQKFIKHTIDLQKYNYQFSTYGVKD